MDDVRPHSNMSDEPIEDFHKHLDKVSRSDASPLVLQMLKKLGGAVVNVDPGNVLTNRKLWDLYAKEWNLEAPWVQNMIKNVSESCSPLSSSPVIGEEWSDRAALDTVINDFIKPYIDENTRVAEIGSGGGRMAIRVAALRPKSLQLFDISLEMLKRARKALSLRGLDTEIKGTHISFCHLKEDYSAKSFEKFRESFDFIYAFDVFVHVDVHTIWQYLQYIHSMLSDTGVAFISTANICSTLGWNRFSNQKRFTVGGFYFISPDIIRHLANKADLEIVQETPKDETNLYYNRDFLCILRKKK